MDPGKPPEARPVLLRRVLADERTPLVGVLVGEQDVEPDVGVAVQRVAIRERELGALGDDVHELGLGELGEVEALEERELLQGSRPGAPRLPVLQTVSPR